MTEPQQPFQSDESIRGSGFGSRRDEGSKSEPNTSLNRKNPEPPGNGLWRVALTVILSCVIAFVTYSALSGLGGGGAQKEHQFSTDKQRPTTAKSGQAKVPISAEELKTLEQAAKVIHPAPSPYIPRSRPNRGLPLSIAVIIDLLAITALVWIWRPGGEVLYEGRVHGGGREFTLTSNGENGNSEPVEVRVKADWAQACIHDGDRLQVHGRWKKQFGKQRSRVEAKRVYNFTTGANWDGKTGKAAAGD